MHLKNIMVLGIVLAVVAVGGFALLGRQGGAVPAAPPAPQRAGPEALLIKTARLITPYDEVEVPDLLKQFEQSCIEACRRVSGSPALSEASCSTFTAAASKRLGLYLDPSFERYRVYAKELSGKDPLGSEATNIIASAEQFESWTSDMRLLPFDPSAVYVRALYTSGRDVGGEMTAGCSYTADLGFFYTNIGHDPKGRGATIYEVLVPVEVPDAMDADKRVRLVLGMAFALDKGGKWMPWRMGFHDPSREQRVIAPPWF